MKPIELSFPPSYDPSSRRLILTPSPMAKQHLLYVQETGHLKLLEVRHHTQRQNLHSFLLVAVREGEGALDYDGVAYPLQAGAFFWIDCRRKHRYQSSPMHPWTLDWVHLAGANVKFYYDLFAKNTQPVFQSPSAPMLHRSLEALLHINLSSAPDAELQNARILTDMLTTIVCTPPDNAATRENKAVLVREYLREHFADGITLDMLAERFYLSKYHIAHTFKAQYGETIGQYLLQKRVTHAKHLLRFTTLSISEVAEACGFSDAGYFHRQFQRTEGVSPSAYRRQWTGKP